MVGNPPYVLLQESRRNDDLYRHFKQHHEVAAYKIDLYHLFIERGIRLLDETGCIAYITPSNFASNNYAAGLRRFILRSTTLRKIVFFDDDVFEASVNNVVFVAQRFQTPRSKVQFCRGRLVGQELTVVSQAEILQAELVTDKCLLVPAANTEAACLVKKLESCARCLRELASVNFGMQLRDRKQFPTDVIEDPPTKSALTRYHRPCYTGKDIHRFRVEFGNRYCFFNREAKRGGCWDEEIHQAKDKVLIRQIGAYPEGGLDTKGYAVLNTAFMIVPYDGFTDAKFLLAVLNSRCVRFFCLNRFKDDRRTFLKIKGEYLKLVPIPRLNLQSNADKREHDALVALVERVLAAKRAAPAADTSALERKMDQRVYRLYALTTDEIKLVAEATK